MIGSEITLRGVTKRFGSHLAVDDVDLTVRPGELLALLGPSGSGKTSLLRIIAGLEAPDSGSILFGTEDASARHIRERQVGFVFQHYALFRHMTVFDNIAFGPRVAPRARRLPRAAIAQKVRALLELIQLGGLADRYPAQLSGGQRQRVALARALAIEPRVLLLDEPFGALDAKVRKELRRWLRALHADVKVTSVFVTHDQEEALELADRVVVMANGRIEQIGGPGEVYAAPATPFVHEFLGDTNRIDCAIDGGRALLPGGMPLGRAEAPNGPAVAYVRPHDLRLLPAPAGHAVIRGVHAVGATARISLEAGGTALEAALPTEHWVRLGLAAGDRAALAVRTGSVFVRQRADAIALQPLSPGLAVVSERNRLA
jgi:sulfate transport system ATP-binding protein